MNKGLDKIRQIDPDQLDSELYFQSLLEQAHTKGLLGDNDIERLQYECLHLLAYKTEWYNTGDSSSIRVEKAQDIMTSNLFTISLWLKAYPNPDDAVTALQNEPINEMYQKGRKRIDTVLASTKTIHSKLLHQLVDTQNVFYRSTIVDGIKGFFKLYDPDFAAHEIHITADYPTFISMPKLAGIEFIQTYLNFLYYENLFCSNFATDNIHHLLCGCVEDYQEHLINIYEPILLTVLGCTIAQTDIYCLDISESGAAHLYSLLSDMPQSEIAPLIQNAANELTRILDCPHGLIRYMQNSLPMIISRIETAVQEYTLDRVFVLPAFPENRPKIIISFGDKMEDEQYRKAIEEIGQCRFATDKVAIIKEHIHSLADLEDVLLDADLTGEETQAVLRDLGLPEVSAFIKKYQVKDDIDITLLKQAEQFFRQCLNDYLSSLSLEQQDFIIQVSESLQIE